jgi:hypothetical protein
MAEWRMVLVDSRRHNLSLDVHCDNHDHEKSFNEEEDFAGQRQHGHGSWVQSWRVWTRAGDDICWEAVYASGKGIASLLNIRNGMNWITGYAPFRGSWLG